jgi:hypothetical protein
MTPSQKEGARLQLRETQELVLYLKQQSRTDASLSFGSVDVYDDVFELVDSIINRLGESE